MKKRWLARGLLLAMIVMIAPSCGKDSNAETECKPAEMEYAEHESKPTEMEAAEPEGDTAVGEAEVSVAFADEMLSDGADYDTFTADVSEFQTEIVFTAAHRVKNFKVLALTYEGTDEDGKILFSQKELYTQETLLPDRPLVVGLTFIGTIPNYGISYEDANGTERCFAVEESGEDGSLLLMEL